MIARAPVCRVMVGRREELRELLASRRAAARGQGGLVLVSGDPGIGKTRLLAEFRSHGRTARASVGAGSCREFGNAPYAPLDDALRGCAAAVPIADFKSRPEVYEAMRARLEIVSRSRAVMLLFEDLHWADQGTLGFLVHLLPVLRGLRLLVVGTFRDEALARDEPSAPYLARLVRDRATVHLALAPLSLSETKELVRGAASDEARASVGRAMLDDIATRSDGNPFFAEELLRSALARSARYAHAAQLPLTIRGAVRERLAQLDDGERRVVTLAAVLGRRFDSDFLADVAAVPGDELPRILRRLRTLQLIDDVSAAGDRASAYAFRHALTRDAIYGELLTVETRPLHRRILAALERRPAAGNTDLGYHAWAAGDAGASVRYNELAGDEACAIHAYADAVTSYERSMQFASEDDVLGRLLQKTARAYYRDGRAARAIELFHAAANLFAASHEFEAMTQAYADFCSAARRDGQVARAAAALRAGLETLPRDRGALRARLQLALAFTHLDRGESEQARALIARSSDAENEPIYHDACSMAAMVNGDVRALRDAAERAIASRPSSETYDRRTARYNLAFSYFVLGADREAAGVFDSLMPDDSAQLVSFAMPVCAAGALLHARAGRLVRAKDLVLRGLAFPEATTGPVGLATAALEIGRLLWDEELVTRVVGADVVETAFGTKLNLTLGRFAGPYARWLAARGERARAQEALHLALDVLAAPFGATETIVAAAELAGDAVHASAIALLPSIDAMSTLPLYAATASHLRALHAYRSGARERAAAHALEAMRVYDAMRWPLHAARCRELAGDDAAAVAVYREHGALGELRRLESAAGGAAGATLSPREREIAELVVAGTPNRDLAARLCVSQRTIEKHLTSIYDKLGLRNRSELAAFVASRRA